MKPTCPSCPRCGYDQSGQILAIETADPGSFPLHGKCSECGLDFRWRDVFRPGYERVKGFVEHSRLWLTPLTAWRTWAWTLTPRRFWNKVALHHSPRARRLFLWVLIVILGPWLLAGIPYAVVGWPWSLSAILGSPVERTIGALIAPWTSHFGPFRQPSGDPLMNLVAHVPVFVAVGAAMSLTFPIVILFLPDTRARAKVRFAHVFRAAIYQFGWLAPVMLGVATQVVCSGIAEIGQLSMAAKMTPVPGSPGAFFYPGPTPYYQSCVDASEFVTSLARQYSQFWLLLLIPWWCRWWWCTLDQGFKIEEHRRVFIAALIPAALAAVIALVLHPEFVRSMME